MRFLVRKTFYIIIFALSFNLYASSSYSYLPYEKGLNEYIPYELHSHFYHPWDDWSENKGIFTLPKAGTHLLHKMLNILLKKDIKIHHVSHFPELMTNQHHNKMVVAIRDPRDQVISLRNMFNKISAKYLESGEVWPGLEGFPYEFYSTLDEETKLRLIILNKFFPEDRLFSLCSEGMKNKGALIIRFEDFIGSKGGGDDALQRETIKKICNYFNHKVTKKEIDYCVENAWGGSKTFHKGQIGAWKGKIDKENLFLIKEKWNKYIIEWGYETDEDWWVQYL